MTQNTAGGPGRGRTCNPWFRRPVLYPLSYGTRCPAHSIGKRWGKTGGGACWQIVPPRPAAGRGRAVAGPSPRMADRRQAPSRRVGARRSLRSTAKRPSRSWALRLCRPSARSGTWSSPSLFRISCSRAHCPRGPETRVCF